MKEVEKIILKEMTALRPLLDPQGAEFMIRNFSGGVGKYRDRLQQIGFVGMDRILDAGCGWGQWAIAMASMNARVDAIDRSAESVLVAHALSRAANLGNLHFQYAALERLPFPDGTFDAVFSYSVLYLTDWPRSLSEIFRVLRPGGTLYVNFQGLGYHLYLWKEQPHKSEHYAPRQWASKAFETAFRRDAQLPLIDRPVGMFTRDQVDVEMRNIGFDILALGDEGTLEIDGYSGPRAGSFFKGRYYDEEGWFEVLARRPSRPRRGHLEPSAEGDGGARPTVSAGTPATTT